MTPKKVVDVQGLKIGEGQKTRVNANIGTSSQNCDIDLELKKLEVAVSCGADAVMDLSTGGKLDSIRKAILKHSSVPIGTVPVYQAMVEYGQNMTANDLFRGIEKHCADGVGFITVHCGVTKDIVTILDEQPRLCGVVSRGGAFLANWIKKTGNENPLFSEYDRLVKIAKKYNTTLSLGDGLRPGALADANDRAQIRELEILGDLTLRAWDQGVQGMIEGPGHMPIDLIKGNIELEKKLCHGAPYYVLGPLVTDIAPGYDHITSAIGGAIAASCGADFLCYVTPAEHLGLPNLEDVREGVITCKIAAHAGDIAKGIPGARDRDDLLSAARKKLDWEAQIRLSIDPEKARAFRQSRQSAGLEACSMCGEFCSMRG
ncbi:MAG: phosphomethylpyrimidine synthase ThiC [Candidatus Margulisiibacteriota bacterium]|jgi:phosphomethylpyrimidine synthase